MLLDLTALSLWTVSAILAGAALAICVAGTRLAHLADTLADRTGMGEIIAGALFVGASTSLPGVITSITTAAQGYPGLAIGNAVGGLTAQTAFLAVADLAYRKANLEHAAASVTGLTQGTLLVSLLTIPLLAMSTPEITFLGVHPASVLLLVCYGFGLRLLAEVQDEPMWSPVQTRQTQDEAAQAAATGGDERATGTLWKVFLIYAAITALAGYAVGEAASALVELTGLSQSAVGTVFAAIANSLPELVTAIAAVRIGAVNLAVGDVIGGNSFEVLFLAAADFFYRPGSIYPDSMRTTCSSPCSRSSRPACCCSGCCAASATASPASASRARWCSCSTSLGRAAVHLIRPHQAQSCAGAPTITSAAGRSWAG